jgi:DNA-binding beta-propeller fold protein YncE
MVLFGLVCLFVFLVVSAAPAFADPPYEYLRLLPAKWCTGVDLSPDGTKIYARAQFGSLDEGAKAFNTTTYAHLGDYHAFDTPWTILASADGAYLYGTDYYGGHVDKVSVATDTVVKTVSVGSWPGGLAFDSNRRLLYVGQNDPGRGSVGSIEVIDTSTDLHLGGVSLNGEPSMCIQVSPDNAYVYAASRNSGSERLYKIRTSDRTTEGYISITGAGEPGFSLSPDGAKAYLPISANNIIRVIDTATMSEVDHIDLTSPGACWVSPDGSHALVVSATSSAVDFRVLDLSSKSVLQTLTISDIGTVDPWNTLRQKPYWDWDSATRLVYVPISASEGGVAVLTPEPATLSLLALGGLAMLRRWGRK